MKLLTWNCNGALRQKFERLLDFNADIHVIQECENPAKTKNTDYQKWANNHLWIGGNKNKGLGIFASDEIKIHSLDWSNAYEDHTVKYFLPCLINDDFQLLAVWTHRNDSPTFKYIGQLWKYMQVNKSRFNKILIVGDFNSNMRWDKWDRWWNHSDVVRELKERDISSLYHQYNNEKQGEETRPTLYFQKNLEKQYHIDYIFGSGELTSRLISFEVGNVEDWLEVSDHVPLVCEFDV